MLSSTVNSNYVMHHREYPPLPPVLPRVAILMQATGVEWQLVDANRPIENIQDEIKQVAASVVAAAKGKEIAALWPRERA